MNSSSLIITGTMNPSDLQHTDQNIPVVVITSKEYAQLKDTEIRKNIIDQKYGEMLLNIEKYVEEIKILKQEKQILEDTICELREKVQFVIDDNEKLQNSNEDLKNRVYKLEIEKENKDRLLKISQCIYEYKRLVKSKITNLKQLNRIDLFEILDGNNFDSQFTDNEINIKKSIIEHYNKLYGEKFGVTNLKSALNSITNERNFNSHPKIRKNELESLKLTFIEYCNEQWEGDELNYTIADDIFNFLKENL